MRKGPESVYKWNIINISVNYLFRFMSVDKIIKVFREHMSILKSVSYVTV